MTWQNAAISAACARIQVYFGHLWCLKNLREPIVYLQIRRPPTIRLTDDLVLCRRNPSGSQKEVGNEVLFTTDGLESAETTSKTLLAQVPGNRIADASNVL